MNILHRVLGLSFPDVKETAISIINNNKSRAEENKQEDEQENEHDAHPFGSVYDIAQITYVLKSNGHISILPNWTSEENRVADAFANLLFLISNGHTIHETCNMLNIYAQHNVCSANFVKRTLDSWSNLNAKINHQPILRPSMVLKAGRIIPKSQESQYEN